MWLVRFQGHGARTVVLAYRLEARRSRVRQLGNTGRKACVAPPLESSRRKKRLAIASPTDNGLCQIKPAVITRPRVLLLCFSPHLFTVGA